MRRHFVLVLLYARQYLHRYRRGESYEARLAVNSLATVRAAALRVSPWSWGRSSLAPRWTYAAPLHLSAWRHRTEDQSRTLYIAAL